MKHISILKKVRSCIAQQNPKKPTKPYGHRIAEVRLQTVEGDEIKDEYTYVDPTAQNVVHWASLLREFKDNSPCEIAIEFPAGVRYVKGKPGLINADVNGGSPIILDIVDPDTGLSKMPKKDPKADLFDFTGK